MLKNRTLLVGYACVCAALFGACGRSFEPKSTPSDTLATGMYRVERPLQDSRLKGPSLHAQARPSKAPFGRLHLPALASLSESTSDSDDSQPQPIQLSPQLQRRTEFKESLRPILQNAQFGSILEEEEEEEEQDEITPCVSFVETVLKMQDQRRELQAKFRHEELKKKAKIKCIQALSTISEEDEEEDFREREDSPASQYEIMQDYSAQILIDPNPSH